MVNEFYYGKKQIIPDFSIGIHTKEGRKKSRDFQHFINESGKTNNTLEVNKDFKEKLLESLKEVDENKKEEITNQFRFNTWQL